jgi:hypothetical protein
MVGPPPLPEQLLDEPGHRPEHVSAYLALWVAAGHETWPGRLVREVDDLARMGGFRDRAEFEAALGWLEERGYLERGDGGDIVLRPMS